MGQRRVSRTRASNQIAPQFSPRSRTGVLIQVASHPLSVFRQKNSVRATVLLILHIYPVIALKVVYQDGKRMHLMVR